MVEDRALSLAEKLDAAGHSLRAAQLREVVPEGFGNCDEHVEGLRRALTAIFGLSDFEEESRRILAALDDLPAVIGRRGRVWVSKDMHADEYSAYWDEDDWLEDGPQGVPLATALAWAERRSDDVRTNW